MIAAISEEDYSRKLSGLSGASTAASIRPIRWSARLAPVQPEPEIVREIGQQAGDAGAFIGSPNLQTLIEGLMETYSMDNDVDEGKAKSTEAAGEIRENTSAGKEAVSGLQESGQAAEEIQRHLDVLDAAQPAGPEGDPEAEATTLEARPESQEYAELPDSDRPEPLDPRDLPRAERGQTSQHLELPPGEAGREAVGVELEAQKEAGQVNQEARSQHQLISQEAEQERSDLEGFQQGVADRSDQQREKIEAGEERRERDQAGLEQARTELDQSHTRVDSDSARVQQDQGLVSASEQNLAVSQEKDNLAGSEVQAAESMWSQAQERVQEASEFRPPTQKSEQGQSQGQGEKKKEEQGAQADKQLVMTSAQRFQQKAAARESAARLRQAMTQKSVAQARQRVEDDREGLARSEEQLETSRKNLETREGNLGTAEHNLSLSETALGRDKEFMERLEQLKQELIARVERNTGILTRLEALKDPLEQNIKAAQENEEKLRAHAVSDKAITRLELRELQVTPG